MKEAEDLIYHSYLRAIGHITEVKDENVKRPELTRRLLDLLGAPDKGQRFILVTGSKGKGSTARFISSLLCHLGMKVGLFTSPHLVHFNERIRVDGKAISDTDFIRISNVVSTKVDSIEKTLERNEYQGPIGIALSLASIYFKEQQTDINVIECGRGGKYDDTNVLENEWAVITPVMEEHIENLGPKLSNIMTHKLGIIKKSTKHVYIQKQTEEAERLIRRQLDIMKRYSYSIYGSDFQIEEVSLTTAGMVFDVRTNKASYNKLTLPLLGEFQALNAGIALRIAEDFCPGSLNQIVVKACFKKIQWPGRCEIIGRNPTVIVDGAINEETATYVKHVVQMINKEHKKKTVSIVSVPVNKDYQGVIKTLSEVSDQLILTVPDKSHLTFPDDDLDIALHYQKNSVKLASLEKALQYVHKKLDVDLIVIAGTQTFIGNAKRLYGHSLMDIGK